MDLVSSLEGDKEIIFYNIETLKDNFDKLRYSLASEVDDTVVKLFKTIQFTLNNIENCVEMHFTKLKDSFSLSVGTIKNFDSTKNLINQLESKSSALAKIHDKPLLSRLENRLKHIFPNLSFEIHTPDLQSPIKSSTVKRKVMDDIMRAADDHGREFKTFLEEILTEETRSSATKIGLSKNKHSKLKLNKKD